ncbi:asparagine synthase (glutamine-hydrolyzing) [Thermomonas sp.]|uniref:asparagine synthase (glutamine-hydrolyzing) n=1 Tax=Thermomonas sp. TaxID=1971895 RepID=UPI0035B3C0DF
MCGLIAAFTRDGVPPTGLAAALAAMQARGPDGEGLWQEDGVALGHRRLAILDLDARAAQPMHSADGRYAIVFNGEIYNFRELRQGLERDGHVFHTGSDTEVLLALFARDGDAMLRKLHGMFAFVVWDRQARRGFAARDPYGIKPLYVATIGNGIMLASQVKALLASGQVSRAPDPEGQAGFWLLGSVPEPRSWYRDIQALPAGHCAWIAEGAIQRMACWHDIGQAWRDAALAVEPDDAAVVAGVRAALRDSVARHLVADVPVGVFLSGGIDSGALAGLMVEAGARDLQGITIAYDEFVGSHQDEAPAAAVLARHYGITHHVRRVGREEFLEDLPRILAEMDQPSIDGINTWYASKAVAELGLKVVVSGVGGDELFQGYRSFRQLPAWVSRWRRLSSFPGALALGRLAGGLHARRTGNARWRHAADWLRSLEGAYLLSRGLFAPDAFPTEADTTVLAQEFDPVAHVVAMTGSLPAGPRLALGQIESMTYLRNQLLRDSDWASMAHSVELRTPLVDAHLLGKLQPLLSSFARFPGKCLLAQAPDNPLPDAIQRRNKTGFGIPVSRWLAEAGIAANDGSRSWARQVASAWTKADGVKA